ncbi:lactate racemase domain-containing protein [Bacillaceae bacterium]
MNRLPQVYRIRQNFPRPRVDSLREEVAKAVDRVLSASDVPLAPGAKIAITGGSRGITGIAEILRAIVARLQERGCSPFIFASMGSHGGGEGSGQREILRSLGVTEESLGVPVRCSHEVRLLGKTSRWIEGLPVYCAEEALKADGVLLVNRVKPHTSFRGEFESGLMKMMAVGMGRAKGASMVHSLGAENLAKAIPAIASVVLERAPVLGGIAIVENAYEETALIEGIPKKQLWEREKELLKLAKSYMPSLPVDRMHLCIVKEMGKNYSGTGMDTNIIGRLRIQGVPEPEKPFIQYLGVLDLSEASHGNATGIGLADFTTERLVAKIDRKATYLNCLTSGFVTRAAVPMTFRTDEELIVKAVETLRLPEGEGLRMVILKNTLHLDELWLSETLYAELRDDARIELVEGPLPLPFTEDGRLALS